MKDTGLVKIIKTPSGTAPLWVRDAWVGLILPCSPIMGFPDNGEPEKDVLTNSPVTYNGVNRRSVSVPQKKALKILRKSEPKAAAWWRSLGFPKPSPDDYFSFGEEEVQIISGVSQQKIVQYVEADQLGVGTRDGQPE